MTTAATSTTPVAPAAPAGAPVRDALRWCGSVLAWVVLLAVLAVLLAAVAVPRLAGATPYTVLTGSMTPTYPPGTLLIVRPADPASLGIGDVITYQIRSGRPEVVTHRVQSASLAQNGENVFVTKGDANPTADVNPVRAVQIRGEVWYAVPLVGYLTVPSGGPLRMVLIGLVILGLVGYALVMLVGSGRDRRRAAAGPRPTDPDADS